MPTINIKISQGSYSITKVGDRRKKIISIFFSSIESGNGTRKSDGKLAIHRLQYLKTKNAKYIL